MLRQSVDERTLDGFEIEWSWNRQTRFDGRSRTVILHPPGPFQALIEVLQVSGTGQVRVQLAVLYLIRKSDHRVALTEEVT
jgi:hypothetical protein